jgi:hypothetical protein
MRDRRREMDDEMGAHLERLIEANLKESRVDPMAALRAEWI